MASIPTNYTLHLIQGNPDERVIHISNLPRFVTFQFPNYTISPTKV